MPLQITQIKPNPAGKDRNRQGQATAAQLAAEWVDFKNIGSTVVEMGAIELWHRAYHVGQQATWEKVVGFTGTLRGGSTVRVHSGSGPESAMRDEDRQGSEYHVFTDKNYVWNNKEGDTPALYNRQTQQTLDSASYDPYPPEGQVLVRMGGKLVSAKAASTYSYR